MTKKMKAVVAGSLGNVSSHIVKSLLEQDVAVTVITSRETMKKEIEGLGATAAVGSIYDGKFLSDVFIGADVAYVMLPPMSALAPKEAMADGFNSLSKLVATNYATALHAAKVPRIVSLSTIGADLKNGNGALIWGYNLEQTLNKLSKPAGNKEKLGYGATVIHLRPVAFYYNLFGDLPTIKSMGEINSVVNGKMVQPWVAPIDISNIAVDEMLGTNTDCKVKYVVSEELTGDQVAAKIQAVAGKPVKWVQVTADKKREQMKRGGMPAVVVDGLVEMYSSIEKGILRTDYIKNQPHPMQPTKLSAWLNEVNFGAACK